MFFFWRENWLPVADADCTASGYKPQKWLQVMKVTLFILKKNT